MSFNNEKEKVVAVNLIISGKVQGVFYRVWARNTAKQLHLKGWVRNLPAQSGSEPGKVEMFLEGKKTDVEKMIEKCREGSKFSEVKNIKVKKVKPKGQIGFEILY